jgi:hypothetical protein
VTAAALIFAWAFLRNIPVAAADRIYGGAWTALGKGLALTGGGLAVAGLPRRWTLVARVCLGAFLISSGVQHFLFVPFAARACFLLTLLHCLGSMTLSHGHWGPPTCGRPDGSAISSE